MPICSRIDCEHGGKLQPYTQFYAHKTRKKSRFFSDCKTCCNKKSLIHQKKKQIANKLRSEEEIYDGTPKKCSSCKQIKSRTKENYSRWNNVKDALNHRCKVCVNEKIIKDIDWRIDASIRTANKKNRVWAISYEYAKSIIIQPCYYCGGFSKTEEATGIKFNGIDRIINSIGYIEGNCRPCCTWCNRMKSNLSEDKFKAKIKKIYKYWAKCKRNVMNAGI